MNREEKESMMMMKLDNKLYTNQTQLFRKNKQILLIEKELMHIHWLELWLIVDWIFLNAIFKENNLFIMFMNMKRIKAYFILNIYVCIASYSLLQHNNCLQSFFLSIWLQYSSSLISYMGFILLKIRLRLISSRLY